MRTQKELTEAKKQIKEYVNVIDQPAYYYGLLNALNWAIGIRKELLTEEDAARLNSTYERLLKNLF